MLRDITLGQYYPSESKVHHMDPRLKIILTLVYIVSLFFIKDYWGYVYCAVILGLVIHISHVPAKFVFKGIKALIVILIFTAVLNIFSYPDGTALAHVGIFTITIEGIQIAIKMCIRLILLVSGASILTLTTSPIQLTDAIERILNPFKKAGLPSHEIAMMMSIALRFIPTLMDETDKIIKAQQARGADFDTGNLIQRAKSLIPILVPLFISAFRRADELAMAMEARCYGISVERTRLNELALGRDDYRAIGIAVIYAAIFVAVRLFI